MDWHPSVEIMNISHAPRTPHRFPSGATFHPESENRDAMASRSASREEGSGVSNRLQTSCFHNRSAVTTPRQLGTEYLQGDGFGASPEAPVYDHMPQLPNQGPGNPAPSVASVLSPSQPLGDYAIFGPASIPATPLDPLMVARAPHIDHINPESGPVTGGTKVNILGENFHPELQCVFGGALAPKTWVSNTAMSAGHRLSQRLDELK